MAQSSPPLTPPSMPPTPRDIGAPTQSELLPFRSKKISIRKSGILVPAAVTAFTCVLLFSLRNFFQIMYVIGGYLLFCIFYACYVYSGVRKNIAVYLFPCLILWLELKTSILSAFILLFREILPGNVAPGSGFAGTFTGMFFGAGLMEELMKAVPALIGLSLALRTPEPAEASGRNFKEWLAVRTPLEGMMLGIAAGAAFIFIETLEQYVPRTVTEVAQKAGAGAGFANGFALLVPRVLQSVVGHMGWAAISGYFIGLAARYPRSMIKLLLMGWLIPSVLHAFWNSSSQLGGWALYLSAALTLVLFVACLLKAKQLETARWGGVFQPSDSILIGADPLAGAPLPASPDAEHKATAWGGLADVVGGILNKGAATAAPGGGAGAAAQPSAATAVQAAAPAIATPRFALACGTARYGIVPGQTIDLAVLFPGQGLPTPSLAEVTVHPQDATAIGLKNMTSQPWVAATVDGASTNVPPGRNVKLDAGEKIKIGPATIDIQAL